MKKEAAVILNDLMAKWEADSEFRKTLREDPKDILKSYFSEGHVEMTPEVDALISDIATKVKSNTDQQLETLQSKGCGGPRI